MRPHPRAKTMAEAARSRSIPARVRQRSARRPRCPSRGGASKAGEALYSWKGERIAQGRDNACKWMLENPQAAEEIRALLVDKRKDEQQASALIVDALERSPDR